MRRKNFAPLGLAVAAVAVPLVMAGTALAVDETWNVASGNWTIGTNWLDGTAPANDGTADIFFDNAATVGSTINNVSWWVDSINKSGGGTLNLNATGGSGRLRLGSGGLNVTAGTFAFAGGSVSLIANQTWSSSGVLQLWGNIASDSGVKVTVNSGQISAYGAAAGFDGNWIFERSDVRYYYAPIVTNNVGVINALGATDMTYRDTAGDTSDGKSNHVMFATGGTGTTAWSLGNTYQLANQIVLDGTFAATSNVGRRLYITSLLKTAEGNVANMGTGIMKFELTGGFSSTSGVVGSAPGVKTSGGAIYLENTEGSTRDSRTQVWLSGDSSGLTASNTTVPGLATGNSVFNIGAGYIVVNNANALGLNNALAVSNHHDGSRQNGQFSGPGMIRALLSNGHDINASIDVTATGYSHNAMFGLTKDYSGTKSFTGDIRLPRDVLTGSNITELGGAAAMPTVLLTAGAAGRVNFTGKIQDNANGNVFRTPVMVQGLGKVKLSNVENSYTGNTGVRSGTLLLGGDAPSAAPGVLGESANAVLLGGEVPSKITVKVAANGEASGTFNAAGTTSGGGTGTFTGSLPTSLDGIALADGDLILLNYQGYTPERNGIYQRVNSTKWERVAALDTASEVANGYGMRVEVQQGATFGGKAFFLANRWIDSTMWNTAPNQTTAQGSGGYINFVEDIANPSVAMLTDGAYTVGRNITVVNNDSTGTATLGGNTAHVSTFAGNVALNKALQVTAANGGTVNFDGDISGTSGVTKIGAGLVKFNNAKAYTGATLVSAGALSVNGTLASTSVNVGNATLQGVGHISGSVTIAGGILSPGNSTGILTVDNNVTLDAASTFKVEVNGDVAGSGYDQLLVGGTSSTVSLGGAALDLIAASELSGSMFWIIRNDSAGLLDGTFAGLSNGAQAGAFTIHYGADFASQSLVGGNDVVLVVPEPATAGLVGLGAAAALMRRRRRVA